MGKWKEVARCKNCKKVYANGISKICSKCGSIIAKEDFFLEIFDGTRYRLTENAEKVIARRKLFKREFKE